MNAIALPRGPRRADIFEVAVDTIDAEGFGLGHLSLLIGPQQQPREYRVLVRKGVPGDVVNAFVESCRSNRIEARIDGFVTPSPQRVTPRCPHFSVTAEPGAGCGGCTFQSLDYDQQLRSKHALVQRMLKVVNVDPALVQEVRGMDDPWYYRNKMEFSFADNGDDVSLGLHPTGYKYDVLDLEACFLQGEWVAPFLGKIRDWARASGLKAYRHKDNTGWFRTLTVREGKRTGERLVELTTAPGGDRAHALDFLRVVQEFEAEDGTPFASVYWTQHVAIRGQRTRMESEVLAGTDFFREQMQLPGGSTLEFEVHPRAFFQPNTRQAEKLYALVVDRAGLQGQTVMDLYCGTGTIGLFLSRFAKHVVGIEMQPDAVENARRNATSNGIENITFYTGDVGKVLEEHALKADVVVVDPPRSGLMPQAREMVEATGASRMVYVSCNPASLARDLAAFHRSGWRTLSVEPVDMFPHTYHIENVALLER
ncbi:MAG: 23S rRNA (uracil(1939)-C(5))-methyltransferase RlmD [bacterium]